MSDLSPLTREYLIVIGFGLLVADRTFALWVVSVKARRILNKRRDKGDASNIQLRAIEWIEKDFLFVLAVILLLSWLVLGLLQTVQPGLILNEVGRSGFALIGFIVSVSSSILNGFIEKLDAKH